MMRTGNRPRCYRAIKNGTGLVLSKRISTRRQKVKGSVLVLEGVTDKPHVVATKDEHGKWTDADDPL